MEALTAWVWEVWNILCESGPYLLVGFFLAGLLKSLIPQSWIMRHLGKQSAGAVTKAALVGAPIPLCSCSVVPTAVSLKEAGASKGATSAFLISTPETGVDSVGITLALMDPIMAIARPVTAILTAIGCGLLVNLTDRNSPPEKSTDGSTPMTSSDAKDCCAGSPLESNPTAGCSSESPDTAKASCCSGNTAQPQIDSCCDSKEPTQPQNASCCDSKEPTQPQRISCCDSKEPTQPPLLLRTVTFAYGKLMADLTPWFVLGFALSAAITLWIPEGFFGEYTRGFPALLAMLVAGAPMYVCATASTPVAAALMAKGLEPGAALVFLLAGPATNAATMGVVAGFLGRRTLGVYVASIAVFSLAAGLLINALYAWNHWAPPHEAMISHEHLTPYHQWGGALLALLLAGHALNQLHQRLRPTAPPPCHS